MLVNANCLDQEINFSDMLIHIKKVKYQYILMYIKISYFI